ncbi:Ger(x)C family spore germination protein [Limnochorda pilosa]|uniref:Germination protein, Ger(X)C family n=1 Tax=Limnochorda pilosa TaxID=1555112 RepID=A0A0K2SH79_LIMPI|nr:Ger(x)C family spore germination protein [Limnochorda pilosa]BAS26450.1 hypothetical protein LIP_0593 [Limnochorda pilosa]
MSRWKGALRALAVVLVALLAGGCWSRREVETLAFVVAAGVDRTPDGRIQLTVQIPIPSALAGGGGAAGGATGGGGTSRRAFWTVSSTGVTVCDAFRNLFSQSPRRPNWSHNEVIVFSEAYAREGIRDALDFFNRCEETRRTTWMTVARDTPIEALLAAEFPTDRLGGVAIDSLLKISQSGLGKADHANVNEFLRALAAPGMEPFATGLMLAAPEHAPPGEAQGETTRQHVRALGDAVFRGDRMVGWIGEREARGLLLMHGKTIRAQVVVPCPWEEDRLATVRLVNTTGKIEPEVHDGMVRMKIQVAGEGSVAGMGCTLPPDRAWYERLDAEVARAMREDVELALQRLQKELRVDTMGFGLALYRRYPKVWRELAGDWDRRLPEIPVTIEAGADVRRTGLTTEPIRAR